MNYVNQKPNTLVQQQIIQSCLGVDTNGLGLGMFRDYVDYYESELLKAWHFGKRFAPRFETSPAITQHEQLQRIVNLLTLNTDKTKALLRNELDHLVPNAAIHVHHDLLELAARIWLMVNIRNPHDQLKTPQTPVIPWESDKVLADVVQTSFPLSRYRIEPKEGRIHPSFTASFMVGVCGLRLEWTQCLADHLRLDRRARALRIFPYKSVIQAHLERSTTAQTLLSISPFPPMLLQETIWSLNILFPHYEPATNQLLKSMDQVFHHRAPFDLPPILDLNEFSYWRDRLSEVHDVIFMSPPASWAQLWRDRRNPQQFWTFWIALIILLLTVVWSMASIVQAWASVKALKS